MTGLLVSVRSAEETEIALAAGVDVIDIKEPSRGSLGAAAAETIQRIVDLVDGRAVVSAACGELLDYERGTGNAERGTFASMPTKSVPRLLDSHLPACGLSLAKVALAGCDERGDWRQCWREWAAALPAGPKPVGVVYADRTIARSPRWEDVLDLAADAGAPYLLVDTFDKSAGTLFDHWSPAELRACGREVRAAGLGLVLAGSLAGDAILHAREFAPDFIAVRGAACRGGRSGTLDASAISQLLEMLGRGPLRRPGNIPLAASELR